jgi:2-amino-4-hydroxy-6-hydroxymethyldihydropteridine diphosphokinase
MNHVLIALGSNITPEAHLPEATRRLAEQVHLIRCSTVWESEPVGDEQQPRFCNAAVLIETDRDPSALKFDVLRRIEDALGRVRDPNNKNAARTIDLDIALFNDDVCTLEDGSRIPDPELLRRPFVAVPLSELEPDRVHPVTGQRLAAIARDLGGASSLLPRPEIDLTPA